MKKIVRFLLVLLALTAMPSLASADWQDDILRSGDEAIKSMTDVGNWQAGINVEAATRGVSSVGGFVGDDAVVGESAYLWHRPSGLFGEVSNSNVLGAEYFDNNQTVSAGIYRETVNDLFVKAGYAYTNMSGTPMDLNCDLHSIFGGLYLPRIFAGRYWDGLRLYGEVQGIIPDDNTVLDGGVMWRVGAKTKLFVPEINGTQLLPNGLDVDASAGGNDGVFGRQSDVLGFGMVRLSAQYDVLGVVVEPYALGVTQARPGMEENETIAVGGLRVGLDFLK